MPHILTMTSEQYKNMFKSTSRHRTNTSSVTTHPNPPSLSALDVEAHISPSLPDPNARPAHFRNALEEHIFVFTVMIATTATTFLLGVFLVNMLTIANSLKMTTTHIIWVVAEVGLTNGAFTPLFGKTAIVLGQKYQLLCGLAWLSIFSLATASATGPIALILFCGCLGLGAATISSPATGALLASYPDCRRRNKILGVLGATNPMGIILGSIPSGVTTRYWSWRASFYTLSIFFLLMTILAFWTIPKFPRPGNTKMQIRHFDYLGTIFAIAGVALFSGGLTQGPELGWNSISVIVMLTVALVCIVAFGVWEHICSRPLLNPATWRNRTFTLCVLSTTFGYMSFITNLFWISLYMQEVQKLAPLQIAVQLLPLAIAGIIWSCLGIILASRVNHIIILGIGGLAYVAGAILIFFVQESSSYWEVLFPALLTTAIGSSSQFIISHLYVLQHMPRHSNMATGLLQTATQLSTPIGLAITAAVYGSQKNSLSDRSDLNLPYSRAYLCSIVFAAIGLIFIPFMKLSPHSAKPILEISDPIPNEENDEEKFNIEEFASDEHHNQGSNTESIKMPTKSTDCGASTWSKATEGTVTNFDDSYFPRWSWEDNGKWEDGRAERYQGAEIVYEVCVKCREERKVIVDGSSSKYSRDESVGLGGQDLDVEKMGGKRGGRLWIGGEWNRELDDDWYAQRGVKDGGSGWV